VLEPALDLAHAVLAAKDAVPATNVTWMLAGTPQDLSRTVVAGTARAGLDLRFEREDGQLDALRSALPDGVRLHVKGTHPPARSAPDGPAVTAMCEALRRHGTEPQIHEQAPWWAPYHVLGVPFASGGPGSAGGAHGPDEWAEVDGKMAPDFDTFIWGWGGDPYDPSILLNLLTTKAIGGSSDSFYSNPEYDRLYTRQAGVFDAAQRKPIVQRMIALSQRDLPYLVLTVDPYLQAYRTDRIGGVKQQCPAPNGDIICDQVSYAPWLGFTPATAGGAAGTADEGGTSGIVYVLIAVGVLLLAAVVLFVIRRRRKSREAIEV
jgi:hypothetical protein